MAENPKDGIAVQTQKRAEIIQATKKARRRKKHVHYVSKDVDKYPQFKGKKFELDEFYDDIIYEDIVMRGGLGQARPVHRIWNYKQEDFPCPMCNKTGQIQFNIQQSGVYLRCWWCNITFGPELPVDPDTNEDRATLLFESFITPSEANKIVPRLGTHRPFGLPQSRSGVRRRRRIS